MIALDYIIHSSATDQCNSTEKKFINYFTLTNWSLIDRFPLTSRICRSSVTIPWIPWGWGGGIRELNIWRSMGKTLQCNALLSVALPMKEPYVKNWCHFIAQRVCFKLQFVGLWYYILRERYTPLRSTHSYQNHHQLSPRRLAVFCLILVSVNRQEQIGWLTIYEPCTAV